MAIQTRVLVVDDSAFMRKVLSDILESAGDIKVAATASNGLDALQKASLLKPDVITLDVEMPEMNGLECLRELQKATDAPVLMVSSLTVEGAKATIEALDAGAIDFITKPTGLFSITGEAKKQEIIEKVRIARGVRRNRPAPIIAPARSIRLASDVKRNGSLKTLVAIGTSTGGPKALQEVLPNIPGDVPAAFLVVQHMPAGFTKSLADRLNTLSELTVKEAEHGEAILPGCAYIAPGDYHMTVDGGFGAQPFKIRLDQNPLIGGHRPAVNVLMNSMAQSPFPSMIGVIMTGMGADGCEGLANMKRSGRSMIISQDEKSCVVYGMPRAAVLSGVVDVVAPLKEIADEIVKNLGV